MKMSLGVSLRLITAVLFLCSSVRVFCSTAIFANSVNDLGIRFNPGTNQVGDEIILAGTQRYLTRFDFEYWGTNTANPNAFSSTVQARVTFYQNNGALYHGYSSPGSIFFQSSWFNVTPTVRSTIYFWSGTDFPANGLYIPVNDMTWSVQFQGMGATDSVGVDLYSPPVVGSDYPDYWEIDNGNWTLLTNSVPVDFGARFYADVPEPSSLILSLVGGLGALTLARRLRRTN
jgi:hypothetical protein